MIHYNGTPQLLIVGNNIFYPLKIKSMCGSTNIYRGIHASALFVMDVRIIVKLQQPYLKIFTCRHVQDNLHASDESPLEFVRQYIKKWYSKTIIPNDKDVRNCELWSDMDPPKNNYIHKICRICQLVLIMTDVDYDNISEYYIVRNQMKDFLGRPLCRIKLPKPHIIFSEKNYVCFDLDFFELHTSLYTILLLKLKRSFIYEQMTIMINIIYV
jgi:hypothetical protein